MDTKKRDRLISVTVVGAAAAVFGVITSTSAPAKKPEPAPDTKTSLQNALNTTAVKPDPARLKAVCANTQTVLEAFAACGIQKNKAEPAASLNVTTGELTYYCDVRSGLGIAFLTFTQDDTIEKIATTFLDATPGDRERLVRACPEYKLPELTQP